MRLSFVRCFDKHSSTFGIERQAKVEIGEVF